MEDKQVQAQIKQMRNFIIQEAEEKASEIQSKAEEEADIERMKIVDAAKTKFRKEYERRQAQTAVQRKITLSKKVNEVRLQLLKQREATIQELLTAAKQRVTGIVSDVPRYKELLTQLIAEGLMELMEPVVHIQCREVDLPLVREVLPEAVRLFREKAPQGVNSKVEVDSASFLPPPPGAGVVNSCSGGVVLTAVAGKVRLSNTLDDRLQFAMDALLPEVKKLVFTENLTSLFDGLLFSQATPAAAPAPAGPAAAAAPARH